MLVIIKTSPRKRFSMPEIIRPIRNFVGLFFSYLAEAVGMSPSAFLILER
jgi:hypothetical protein